ncbi:Hypothetical_protein [Hexamita inflata]|uniref:Hypothetical_protein n=1 Tax=Hexamita inflata TaxID=28002 RepID=A0AA86UTL6_9EUKA|nr:Hypothetical protein HINF_LOCUS51841 [Hexamita inflata]
MYRQGLTELQIEDCSEKQPKQLCQIINNLSSKQKNKLWKYLEKNIQPTKPQSQHSDYYERQYQRHLYTEHLSQQDIYYIKQFTLENQELLIIERKQLLMDGYFKNRDIFDYDIYKFIQMCDRKKSVKIDRQYIFQEKQKKERTINYTQVFKQALQTTTNQQTDNMSAKQICESINSLSGQQQQQFWQLAVENFQPKKLLVYLRIIIEIHINELYMMVKLLTKINNIFTNFVKIQKMLQQIKKSHNNLKAPILKIETYFTTIFIIKSEMLCKRKESKFALSKNVASPKNKNVIK